MAVQTLGEDPHSWMIKLPAVVAEAVREVAAENYETAQAFMRRTIIEALRAKGKLP